MDVDFRPNRFQTNGRQFREGALAWRSSCTGFANSSTRSIERQASQARGRAEIRPPVQGQPSRPVTPTPKKPSKCIPTFSQAKRRGPDFEGSVQSGGESAGGQARASSRGDAIAIIAAGTRKGVHDGLTDFWQMMRGLNKGGGGGITPASYETGAGRPGDGAGGRGDDGKDRRRKRQNGR